MELPWTRRITLPVQITFYIRYLVNVSLPEWHDYNSRMTFIIIGLIWRHCYLMVPTQRNRISQTATGIRMLGI